MRNGIIRAKHRTMLGGHCMIPKASYDPPSLLRGGGTLRDVRQPVPYPALALRTVPSLYHHHHSALFGATPQDRTQPISVPANMAAPGGPFQLHGASPQKLVWRADPWGESSLRRAIPIGPGPFEGGRLGAWS